MQANEHTIAQYVETRAYNRMPKVTGAVQVRP